MIQKNGMKIIKGLEIKFCEEILKIVGILIMGREDIACIKLKSSTSGVLNLLGDRDQLHGG